MIDEETLLVSSIELTEVTDADVLILLSTSSITPSKIPSRISVAIFSLSVCSLSVSSVLVLLSFSSLLLGSSLANFASPFVNATTFVRDSENCYLLANPLLINNRTYYRSTVALAAQLPIPFE